MKATKLDDNSLWFGLTSTFLIESKKQIENGKTVSIKFDLQKSSLQPPPINLTNVFLVSNSTGIAPFRAFLQQKDCDLKCGKESKFGKITLLFGCRNREIDYIFADELEDFCSRNTLTALFEAFSREEVKSLGQKSIRSGCSCS